MSGVKSVGFTMVVLSLGTIGLATLRPDSTNPDAIWQHCLVCGDRPAADAIANVLLFAPLGVGLAMAAVTRRRVWLLAGLVSALVELGQLVLPGRYPTFTDIAFNVIGAGAGAALWRGLEPGALVSRTILWGSGLAGAIFTAAAIGATAWLLSPSLPGTRYWGQWTPYRGKPAQWYRGRVLDAHVGDTPVRSRRIPESAAVRAELSDSARISIRFVAGPQPPDQASLFSIADERQRFIASLDISSDDLVFSRRARATAAGLDQPSIAMRGGMRGIRAGDPVHVRVWEAGRGTWCISVNERATCGIGYSAADGWALVYAGHRFPHWLRQTLRAVWLAALTLLIGLGLRPTLGGAAALLLTLLALVPGSRALGLLAPDGFQWAGVLLGLVAGQLVRRPLLRPVHAPLYPRDAAETVSGTTAR